VWRADAACGEERRFEMIRSDCTLYLYQCKTCGTTAVAAHKATYGEPYTCLLCRSWMKFVYGMPVETPEQRSWHTRGLVYNPGTGRDPLPGSMREIPK
jgi:hypothetical protein